MLSQTYDRDRSLNVHGVLKQPRATTLTPVDASGDILWASDGGKMSARKSQIGWRIICDKCGKNGGYDISVGQHIHHTIPAESDPIDITISEPGPIVVDVQGMLSGDWAPLLVERLS